MPEKFDPDERFSLYPMEGEEVVKKLLKKVEPAEPADEDESPEDDA